MKKVLPFVLTFSLTHPLSAQDVRSQADLVDQYSSAGGKGMVAPSCKAESTRFFSRSQSSLVSVFSSLECQEASKETIGVFLTRNDCINTIDRCLTTHKEKIGLKEKEALEKEFMGYFVRENVRTQLLKYDDPDSKELRDLITYAEKLPEEFRSQIKFCPEARPSVETCLNDPQFDAIAKVHFSALIDSLSMNPYGVKAAGRRSAGLGVDRSTLKPESAPKTQGFGIKMPEGAASVKQGFGLFTPNIDFNSMRQRELLEATQDKSDANKRWAAHLKIEKDWALSVRAGTNSLFPSEDKLLDEIVKSVIQDVGKLSKEQLKEKMKKAAQRYALEGDDLILTYTMGRDKERFAEEFDKLNITDEDLFSADRQSLSKKLNGLRVNLANQSLAKSCPKTIVSYGQMCARISANLSRGTIDGEPVDLKDPDLFKKMQESFLKTSGGQGIPENQKHLYASLENVNRDVYNNFFGLLTNRNICMEKFPGSITPDRMSKESIKQYLADAQKSADEGRDKAAQTLVETARKDETFRKELVNRGIDIDSFKINFGTSSSGATLSQYKEANDLKDARELSGETLQKFVEKFDTGLKPMGQEGAQPSPNALQPPMTPQNFTIGNNSAIAAQDQQTQNADDLRERIRALEKKEGKLRKSLGQDAAISSTDDSSASKDNDELAALRKQIEELKAERDKTKTAENPASPNKEDARPMESSSASERSTTLRSSADKTASEFTRPDDQVMNRSLASSAAGANADYPAEVQAAAGGGRAPASQSAGGAAGSKGSGEKGAAGLVLTKNGEAVDAAAILENPNEGDIALLMEKTKGEPFLIRENGELVKVAPILDSRGKPIVSSDGKIKFKKIKLTKAQQELIAKETNITKAAKEVGVEPVRLYKLKSLLKDVRR